MTALATLTAARARVATGWCKFYAGQWRDVLGYPERQYCVCASHAINMSTTGEQDSNEARRLLWPVTGRDLVVWNDAAGRTQEEVVAAFDAAIKLARGGR